MSNDPSSGDEQQPGWHGQQPYPGGYGQQPEQPAYGSYPQQPGQQPTAGYGQATSGWQQAPGQQRYPGTPPGYPAGLAGMPPQDESQTFFGSLFDFGFRSFAAPVIIKVLYILGLVVMALAYIGYVFVAFTANGGLGLMALLLGAVGLLFWVMIFRLALELYYAVVRMSEDIRAMRNRS